MFAVPPCKVDARRTGAEGWAVEAAPGPTVAVERPAAVAVVVLAAAAVAKEDEEDEEEEEDAVVVAAAAAAAPRADSPVGTTGTGGRSEG